MFTKPSTTKPSNTAAPVSPGIGRAFEWFLELPVAVVLLVLWVVGVALLGAWGLVAYALISALVVE
jgi:hypothetical protein